MTVFVMSPTELLDEIRTFYSESRTRIKGVFRKRETRENILLDLCVQKLYDPSTMELDHSYPEPVIRTQ